MTKKYYTIRWNNGTVTNKTSYKLFDVGQSIQARGFFGIGGTVKTGIVLERYYYKDGEKIEF